MSTATLERPQTLTRPHLMAQQREQIYTALTTGGQAIQQNANGERLGGNDASPAAVALIEDMAGFNQTAALSCLFQAVLDNTDQAIALHARSLVYQLIAAAADLNVTAILNGDEVPVRFTAGSAR